MGYILHHAIVVTGFASKSAEAYARAPEDLRTAFSEIQCNGYRSFLVCPDGGKEGDGWAGGTSDQGDAARERFKAHLRALEIEWVEVAFGHDDGRAYVTDSQWPQPEAPRDTRWTDAEFAAEQVALARRQAEVARAEARETDRALEAALAERDAVRDGWAKRADDSQAYALRLRAELDVMEAERDKLRTDLEALGQQNAAALSRLMAERNDALEELAETRAVLEAARAAVHTPSPGGSDAWSPPAWYTPEMTRAWLAEGAKMERPPEGRDPATRTRALPVVPLPDTCGECGYCLNSPKRAQCHHPRLTGGPWQVRDDLSPPEWCQRRAELAKAGEA